MISILRRAALCGPGWASRRCSTAAASADSSGVWRWAVGGWAFFIAENVVLSENRTYLTEALAGEGGTAASEGESRYGLVYGAMSTAACASIALGYRKVRGAPPLQWPIASSPPTLRLGVSLGLQALAMAGLSQALPKLQVPVAAVTEPTPVGAATAPATASGTKWKVRCPFDFGKPAGGEEGHVQGAERVSRHVGLWSFALLCLGESVVAASMPQAVCLAMPTLMALVGGWHMDSRHGRGMGGSLTAERAAQTSNVPFLAMATGRQGDAPWTAMLGEGKGLNAALALVLASLWALRRGR